MLAVQPGSQGSVLRADLSAGIFSPGSSQNHPTLFRKVPLTGTDGQK